MKDQNSYIAHLIAQRASEAFLLAYGRAESGDDTANSSRETGIQTVRELAAHLGFALLAPVDSIAPRAVSGPANDSLSTAELDAVQELVSEAIGASA